MIDKFNELKLSDYPIAEIDNLMTKLEPIAILLTEFSEGKEIERAVNNTKEEPEFSEVSRISFKPEIFNHNYLRASTPNNTMFYGTVLSKVENGTEPQYDKIVSSTEVSSLMRGNEIMEGWSRITYGKWVVKEKLSLATVIDPCKNYDKEYLNIIKLEYVKYLDTLDVELKNNTLKWLKYFTTEFEKKVSNGNNHDYLISSKFTEKFVNTSIYDGVIYPSVQSGSYGLCVAINPRAMHKLKPHSVSQCKIIKTLQADNENHFLIKPEKSCFVEENATTFKLKDINNIA